MPQLAKDIPAKFLNSFISQSFSHHHFTLYGMCTQRHAKRENMHIYFIHRDTYMYKQIHVRCIDETGSLITGLTITLLLLLIAHTKFSDFKYHRLSKYKF